MRMLLIFWALCTTGQSPVWVGISGRIAGNVVFAKTRFHGPAFPSKEAFINEIFRSVVDSSFSAYNLCDLASPCSFVKFEYDEWVKYALQETVTIGLLNELAKKCYDDRAPAFWDQGQLVAARCISKKKTDSLLNAEATLPSPDSTANRHRQKKLLRQKWKKWSSLPAQERTVFYFSRPEFTDNGEYAIIDLEYRCDARLCGMGATCLFRHTQTGWKMIGKKIRWGG